MSSRQPFPPLSSPSSSPNPTYSSMSSTAVSATSLHSQVDSFSKVVSRLDRLFAKIGTKSDNADFRDRMHDEQMEATRMAKDIVNALKGLSSSPIPSDGPSALRLSALFQKEFQNFQKIQRKLDEKQIRVIKEIQRHGSEDIERGNQQTGGFGDFETQTSRDQSDELSASLLSRDAFQIVEFNAEEIERRTAEIHQIERQVVEVADIFKDLQTLVNQQQAPLDMITDHVSDTAEQIKQAEKQLVEAENYQAKARRRKCCCVMILLIVIGVIAAVIAIAK